MMGNKIIRGRAGRVPTSLNFSTLCLIYRGCLCVRETPTQHSTDIKLKKAYLHGECI